MFKGILNQRDEDKRCHLNTRQSHLSMERYIHVLRQADLHQRNVVLDKLHLIRERYLAFLIIV